MRRLAAMRMLKRFGKSDLVNLAKMRNLSGVLKGASKNPEFAQMQGVEKFLQRSICFIPYFPLGKFSNGSH